MGHPLYQVAAAFWPTFLCTSLAGDRTECVVMTVTHASRLFLQIGCSSDSQVWMWASGSGTLSVAGDQTVHMRLHVLTHWDGNGVSMHACAPCACVFRLQPRHCLCPPYYNSITIPCMLALFYMHSHFLFSFWNMNSQGELPAILK